MLKPVTHAALSLTLAATWTALALALLHAAGPDWRLYAPATCLGTHCFCEAPRTGSLLLQPANTVSSLGFVLVGAWIMLDAVNTRSRALGPTATLVMGFCTIVIGMGSVLLHATLSLWGQFADVVGMYLLGSFLLAWALRRRPGLGDGAASALYIILAGAQIFMLWVAPESRRWLFGVTLVAAIGLEWWYARQRRAGVVPRLFLVGLAANGVAFMLWIADQTLVMCDGDSWLQGHAAWHLLGAVAVACSFAYFRGEQSTDTLRASR